MPAHEIAPPRSKPPVKNTTKEHPHRDERYHRDSAGSDKAASVKGSRHHSIKSSQDYSSDQRSSNSSSKQKVPPSSGSSHHTADRLGQQPQYNNVRDADRLHPDSARTSSRGKEREPSNSSHASPRSTHITPEELDDELAFLELNDGDDPPPSQSLRQSKRRTANNDTTISDYDEKHPR